MLDGMDEVEADNVDVFDLMEYVVDFVEGVSDLLKDAFVVLYEVVGLEDVFMLFDEVLTIVDDDLILVEDDSGIVDVIFCVDELFFTEEIDEQLP